MRIQGYRPDDVAGAGQAQGTQGPEHAQQGTAGSAGTPRHADSVEVSNDARLVSTALLEASRAPAIRPDVVERAKAKLAAGEVGTDAYRLADRMIDALISR